MSQIEVNIIFFAKSRELVGLNTVVLKLDTDTLTGDQLLATLINTFPK